MSMGDWRRGPIIGRGSSAAVSLGYSSPSGEVFAVKSAELPRSAHLQKEQMILSTLDCPNIISCLGFDITAAETKRPDDERLCYNLFIEYAPGGSLSDQIKKQQGGRLDEFTIRSHTHEILTGLAYLHSSRLAHCDIKAQNILIGSDGQAKIADLGCARWTDEDEDGDGDPIPISGTPMFMAPEVARGEDQRTAADVWALGCTIIEMATGKPPWPDATEPITVLHRIAFSSDVPELPSWVSDECKDFLDKCLRRDPKERWTADQLLKHPFANRSILKSYSGRHWDWASPSPKSNLDHHFWDALPLCEDDEDEHPSHDPAQRIHLLLGGGSGFPNWTWDDENWLTIRWDRTTPMPEEVEISADKKRKMTEHENNCTISAEKKRKISDAPTETGRGGVVRYNATLEYDPSHDPAQRIHLLLGGSSEFLNWTWDENWVTIRSHRTIPIPEEHKVEISADIKRKISVAKEHLYYCKTDVIYLLNKNENSRIPSSNHDIVCHSV